MSPSRSLAGGLTPKLQHSRLQWWLNLVNQNNQAADPVTRRIVLVASSGAGRF